MKTRKILTLLLATVMLVSVLAACGDKDQPPEVTTDTPTDTSTPPKEDTPQQPGVVTTPDEPSVEPPDEPPPINSKTPRDTLVVGTPAMNGNFINGWGNSSYDLYIKTLTGGYHDTYFQTPGGQLILNETIIKNLATSVDGEGNKTYTFTIWEDLKWNDGSPILAKEFVAGMMLYASPEFGELGVTSMSGDGLVGYEAFAEGETQTFAGAQVLGDHVFSLTIDKENLPYFWETSFVAYGPIPMDTWLPGIDVDSSADGCTFTGDWVPLLQNISDTERFGPSVSCGPYKFISFDGSTVTLQRNPYFKGDPWGNLPKFEYIVQREVPDVTDVDLVIGGDIDLTCGVIEGAKIEAARASEFAVDYSYLRAGYGYIGFACDFGPTKDANVRKAIAHMIDRNAIIDHVLGGFGGTVDAAYGMAQWTYQARRRELAEALTPIAFNLEKANDFLDASEWKFEEDGTTPFDRSKAQADGSYMRYNAEGEMLVIRHMSASTSVGTPIESETLKNGPMIGMKYELTPAEFSELLDNYYYGYEIPESDRVYHAFNLATNFTVVDDKYYSWHSDWLGTDYNPEQFSTPEIDRITMEMRFLDPTETEKHADLWVEFQVEFQKGQPQFPLYSNEYFDIHNSVIKGINTSPYANYCDVICEIEKWP